MSSFKSEPRTVQPVHFSFALFIFFAVALTFFVTASRVAIGAPATAPTAVGATQAVGADDELVPLCPIMAARMGVAWPPKPTQRQPLDDGLKPMAPPPPPFVPPDPPTNPMGVARGIFPGRVVWDYDPSACLWNGVYSNKNVWSPTNYWWEPQNTDQAKVDAMVSRCLQWLTGATNDSAAWHALFVYFNVSHGLGSNGYVSGEGISIKPNLVNCWNWSGGNNYLTYPVMHHRVLTSRQVLLSLLRQLVNKAGVPQTDITVYANLTLANFVYQYLSNEFPRIRRADAVGGNGTELNTNDYRYPIYPSNGMPTDYPPQTLTRSKYLINAANLKTHEAATGGNNPDGGTNAEFPTLCAKNHFGSLVDGAGQYHNFIEATNAYAIYHILPDLMEHKDIGGKTLLYLLDGLYGGLNKYDSLSKKWLMPPFSSNWPASIMMSLDVVAIDSVGQDFLRCERALQLHPLAGSIDSYLHEAALITNPPSGVVYDPDGDGPPVASLGVHEHWDDATNKQYSSNLGRPGGIELFTYEPLTCSFTATTVTALPSFSVCLQASAKAHGSIQPTALYRWDFDNDGTIDAEGIGLMAPTATYNTVGTRDVRLTTINGMGETATALRTSYITVIPPVSAAFGATPTNGVKPLSVTFTDLSTNAPQYWYWNFSNGTSTVRNPTHIFTEAGKYTVQLLVSNDFGIGGWSVDQVVKTEYITVTPEPAVGVALLAIWFAGARRRRV